jgi:hypothetical protein
MHDGTSKETARERARRIWANAQVQKFATNEPQPINKYTKSNKLRRHILQILTTKNDSLLHRYIISIEMRRRALLYEKLKRLRAQQDG